MEPNTMRTDMKAKADIKATEMRWAPARATLALALLAVTAGACGSAEAGDTEAEAGAPEFTRVVNVEVMSMQPESFVEEIRLTSVALAHQDVTLSAEESGVIRTLHVERGERVSVGDPIAEIDGRVLAAEVEQARAQASLAAQTWERRKRLWEEDQAGSELAYLEAKYAAEQTAANLSGLEERLARTTIRAPFAGVVDERIVEVGSMVSPGDPIARLVSLDPIKVVAGVPERYATDVAVGEEAVLSFAALDGRVYTAPIRYVGSTVDPQNRTFAIEVLVTNPGRLIKPQMVADMAITRRHVEGAIVVPQDALVRVEDGYVVFVATERAGTQVAEVRPVVIGPARRDLVVLTSGVEEGDRLIVVGQKSVADGDRINIVGERG